MSFVLRKLIVMKQTIPLALIGIAAMISLNLFTDAPFLSGCLGGVVIHFFTTEILPQKTVGALKNPEARKFS
jgi:hypothetical protein